MALDGVDRERLVRIENELAADDPRFAARLRRWEPTSPVPGWSVAPSWVLLVFVVAFVTWVVASALGVALVVVGASLWLGRRLRARAAVRR